MINITNHEIKTEDNQIIAVDFQLEDFNECRPMFIRGALKFPHKIVDIKGPHGQFMGLGGMWYEPSVNSHDTLVLSVDFKCFALKDWENWSKFLKRSKFDEFDLMLTQETVMFFRLWWD